MTQHLDKQQFTFYGLGHLPIHLPMVETPIVTANFGVNRCLLLCAITIKLWRKK